MVGALAARRHITYAHQCGASDRAIAHQTRHRSLATAGIYVRIDNAWEDNSVTRLGSYPDGTPMPGC